MTYYQARSTILQNFSPIVQTVYETCVTKFFTFWPGANPGPKFTKKGDDQGRVANPRPVAHSRPIASRNQSQTQLMWPVATDIGLGSQRAPGSLLDLASYKISLSYVNPCSRYLLPKILRRKKTSTPVVPTCQSLVTAKYKQFTTVAITDHAVASFSHHTRSAAVQQVCRTGLTTVKRVINFSIFDLGGLPLGQRSPNGEMTYYPPRSTILQNFSPIAQTVYEICVTKVFHFLA